VLLAISLPRIYVGGHYPVDVLAAILLSAIVAWIMRRVCADPRVSGLLARIISKRMLVECLLFLWLFELAESFRSTYSIATYIAHATQSFWR
jgi:energy-converting hydrogenase Eha subunit B